MAGFLSKSATPRAKPILSIRARLVVLALLVVVPLMLDRVRLLESSRTQRIEVAGQEALDLAKRGAEAQREIMTMVRGMLQVMARAYVTMMARGETCNMYLSDFAGNMPWVRGLSVIGPDGQVKCSTAASGVGLDLSDRDYYRAALETRDFVTSNYVVGRVLRSPAIMAAYPTLAIDSTVKAVIVASVDLHWVNGLVSSLQQRPGSTVLLIDGAGTLVAGDPETAGLIGQYLGDSPLVSAIASRDQGTTSGRGLDGARRIFGFVRTSGSDAHLAVGLDEVEILQRIDREILLAYVQLALFGLVVLLIAWFGGERLIVEPIRLLARTATRIGRGEHDGRQAGMPWAAEFAPLATALNDTARKLAERERDLRATNRHLEELASLDSLSGLANRRGFDGRLTAEWQRAGKLGRPIALLMVDVDHFKLFNDSYGHVEGDVCLRRMGKLMMDAAAGDDDLPARYGGEEFALLLPSLGIDQACAIAERLRCTVEDLCIAHASSPSGQVTVSIGVASLIPRVGVDAKRLVEAADLGLYAAKRRGRNTVVVQRAAVALAAAG